MSHALHPRITEVVSALGDAQRECEAMLQSIAPAQHAARAGDGWTIAQIVDHLAIVEDGAGRLVGTLIKQAAGTRETDESPVAPSIERFRVWDPSGRRIEAPAIVVPTTTTPLADSAARLATARARMIAAFEAASGLALGQVAHPHPVLGPLTAYQWGHVTAHHQRRHLAQIRTILAAQS